MKIENIYGVTKEVLKFMTKRDVLLCATLSGALLLSACSPKNQVYFGADINLGPIPDDVCIVNGKKEVISSNIESDGEVTIFYLSRTGEYVNQKYAKDLSSFGTELTKAGSYRWSGGTCMGENALATPLPITTPTFIPFPTPQNPFVPIDPYVTKTPTP